MLKVYDRPFKGIFCQTLLVADVKCFIESIPRTLDILATGGAALELASTTTAFNSKFEVKSQRFQSNRKNLAWLLTWMYQSRLEFKSFPDSGISIFIDWFSKLDTFKEGVLLMPVFSSLFSDSR